MNLTAVCPGGNPFHSLGLTIKAKFFLLKKKKKKSIQRKRKRRGRWKVRSVPPACFTGKMGVCVAAGECVQQEWLLLGLVRPAPPCPARWVP